MRERPRDGDEWPLAYLITFCTYGSRLHGEDKLTVDRNHNLYGGRFLEEDPDRAARARNRMASPPYELDAERRDIVLRAIREVCSYRSWELSAAHVRSNHVHVVVSGETPPEKALNDFKSYAGRALNRAGLDSPDQRRWARHGSTVYLFESDRAEDAVGYVVYTQGAPMAVFKAERPFPWE